MRAGTIIDYRLRLFGVPFRWRTLIEAYVENDHFVDRQLKGPYKLWRHTHSFERLPNGHTSMRDLVEYEVPLGPLGEIARRLFAKRHVERIFSFRAQVLERLLTEQFGQLQPARLRQTR